MASDHDAGRHYFDGCTDGEGVTFELPGGQPSTQTGEGVGAGVTSDEEDDEDGVRVGDGVGVATQECR